jgi:outer membrane protein assembly factor BamB
LNYTRDVQSGGVIVEDYLSPDNIWFGFPDVYTSLGVTTFRGDNFRNSPAWGTVNVSEEKLAELYHFRIGSLPRRDGGAWTGSGWTGQPGIVQWDADVRAQMNIKPEKKEKDGLIEVIYATMDGNIYFFDLDDGQPTRDPVRIGQAIKGAVTIDPRGYPIMYVGQGDVFGDARFGYYIFSLIDCKEMFFINGRDSFARRSWAAFDSNPLFDTANDRMFLCGENGVVYSIKLNTVYDRAAGTVAISPDVTRYRYNFRGIREHGFESSPTAFGHYMFVSDNHGMVHCIDLMTLQPVWVRDVTDNSDGTVVLDWEEDTGTLALYTGCSVKWRESGSPSYLRKINAENGELLWERSYLCRKDPGVPGGSMSTPISGKHDIGDYVIFWVAKLTRGQGGDGVLICLDKKTGETVWEKFMPHYGYSSPVAVYTEEGKSYIIVFDSIGDMVLIRGTTGETLDKINIGANVESSPAVFGNKIVVGTRGQRIYGLELR